MCRIIKSPTYLVRNPYSYCFRINVPNDLQRYIGKTEIRRSLKTGFVSQAKHIARKLAAEVQTLFDGIREMVKAGDLTDHEIKEIVNTHLQQMLSVTEFLRTEYMGYKLQKGVHSLVKRYHSRLGEESKRELAEPARTTCYTSRIGFQ